MLLTTLVRLLLVIAIVAATLHRGRAYAEKGAVSQREEGWVIIPLRLFGLGLWVALLAYIIRPALLAFATLPLPLWLRWAGFGLMVAGIALAVWGMWAIGSNVTKSVVTREDHTLVTHGPYHWVRHPLYTAGILLFGGFGLATANAFVLVSMALVFVFLMVRLPEEEARLLAHFGDAYREYRQQTGAFFPRGGWG